MLTMRVFALSDVHIDYDANAQWIANVSLADYQDDVLILAGDVTDVRARLAWCIRVLARRFKHVLFVPGNHDLWVIREDEGTTSLQKFDELRTVVSESGASMDLFRDAGVSIVPLLAWYDYSFGEPCDELRSKWMDFRACRWPRGYTEHEIVSYFTSLNPVDVHEIGGDTVITFSHFVPRIDVMPQNIPRAQQVLNPILGSAGLERQLRSFNPLIHVYGHSHINRYVTIDGVSYVNNAFGYPHETRTTSKELLCIHEC